MYSSREKISTAAYYLYTKLIIKSTPTLYLIALKLISLEFRKIRNKVLIMVLVEKLDFNLIMIDVDRHLLSS